MFKSLYSGVSGLSANLTNLDVIGNNIANSNTVGFKSGRVTFSEMLTQSIKPASRPVAGGLGGTNPQQVGLGTRVGSIDTNFNQGNFQTTGKKTDIAIQGNGFFMLTDGNSRTYTRAGVFGLDSTNYLVSPSTGLKVLGVMADENGVLPAGPMEEIYIDPGLVVPAAASTEVQMQGNLDASSDAKPTITQSPSFLVAAEATDNLLMMSSEFDGPLDLDVGSLITLNGRSGATDLSTNSFEVMADSTYQDLVDWLNTETAGTATFAIDPSGALQVTNTTGADLDGVSLAVSGKEVFNSIAFGTVAAGATELTMELRSYADENDTLDTLYGPTGQHLNIDFTVPNPTLNLGGRINGELLDPTAFGVTAGTTLGELAREIQYALGAYSTPPTINDHGQVVITGEVGLASSIDEISVAEAGRVNTVLDDAFDFAQIQQAEDQKTFTMATRVYDSLGIEHTVNFTFEKVAGENEWIWQAEMEGTETLLSGGSGRIRFSETGSVSSFSFDDNVAALTFRPQATGQEGAEDVVLEIDYGDIGALSGLTQFDGEGNLQSIADGYTAGTLVDFSIDQSGVITGIFSNDTTMGIAQIGIAQFSNPAGLVREANNTYRRSGNSGQAMETFAGLGNGVTLAPGALETSNVDLAREFTNLVVAQRSFQANSRVVSTSDQIMQELVNLIR